MRCPRCKKLHSLLTYTPLLQIEEFADETVPVVKCPSCRWLFAPAPLNIRVLLAHAGP